jgi:hypothetical protein
MGDTRRFAERMGLIDMEPRLDVASTGYALVNEGKEYLVLEPTGDGAPFTVTLEAGTYTAEWYSVSSRATEGAASVTIRAGEAIAFTAPFADAAPAVLYLKRA